MAFAMEQDSVRLVFADYDGKGNAATSLDHLAQLGAMLVDGGE